MCLNFLINFKAQAGPILSDQNELLIKELSDKKIILNDKLCLYIIKRIKRNYKSISLFAETLDIMSLEQKTKITLKRIKEVLNIIETNS